VLKTSAGAGLTEAALPAGDCVRGRLGGVAGPASFGLVHPFDGLGVQTKEAGEHDGGHLGSEIDQGSAEAGLDGDAEATEPVGQPCRGDRRPGSSSGEQPGAVGRRTDTSVGLAVGDQREQQVAEWPGTGASCWPS
jgi:hypothetical protein